MNETIEIEEDEGLLQSLNNFLIISVILVVIVPSIIYFLTIIAFNITIPFNIAVYLMLFSGLTNMEIWLLSMWTAKTTLNSVDKLKQEGEKYKELLSGSMFQDFNKLKDIEVVIDEDNR